MWIFLRNDLFSASWFDSGYMFFQFTEAFVLGSCDRFSSCSPVLCFPRSCRQRHWYAWAGFARVDALRAMFISFVTVHSALLGPQWYMLCVSLRSGRISCFSTRICGLRILRSILDSQDTFCGPLHLTVTCTVFVFAFGVPDYGISWELLHELFTFSALSGSTVDTRRCQCLRLVLLVT